MGSKSPYPPTPPMNLESDQVNASIISPKLKISDLWQEEEIKYQEPKEEISVAPPPPPPVINPKKR